jgi:hypothetical protein
MMRRYLFVLAIGWVRTWLYFFGNTLIVAACGNITVQLEPVKLE